MPGTISGIQTGANYGLTVTCKLDTPHNGVPYMYNIHLAAIEPSIQIGKHINAGNVIGYSGGLDLLILPINCLQDCQTTLIPNNRQEART